jgi:hypothetical protein
MTREEPRPFERLDPEFSKESQADFWQLTRECTVVVGTVATVAARVTMKVEQVLKGNGVAETVSFPAPPRITDHPVELAHRHPGALHFEPTDRWILFLDTPAPGVYKLRAGASGTEVPQAERSVKESFTFDALLDDRSRCAFLVQIAADRGRSWQPALQLLGRQHGRVPPAPRSPGHGRTRQADLLGPPGQEPGSRSHGDPAGVRVVRAAAVAAGRHGRPRPA